MTHSYELKYVPRPVLAEWAKTQNEITLVSGCFDLLHAGHVALIEEAYRLGHSVLAAINSDDSIRRLKGDKRPVMCSLDRAEMLAALQCVKIVTVFEEDDPSEVIRLVRPRYWVKGGDHALKSLPERDLVESLGGQVIFFNYRLGYSTTNLVERIKKDH